MHEPLGGAQDTSLLADARLMLEPAGAAATAALLGPLAEKVRGKRVVSLVCGSNLDLKTFGELTAPTGGASL